MLDNIRRPKQNNPTRHATRIPLLLILLTDVLSSCACSQADSDQSNAKSARRPMEFLDRGQGGTSGDRRSLSLMADAGQGFAGHRIQSLSQR
ncbi:hypothetical protein CA13_61500 [Planctomycetes bacterium CA13]|uniref:Uncharacterized protein n=1 Tax=Novipirellula herctigrandis TaxID=2527986 RepID=A0A5C5ZC02_9BACT|nr:hypothetical protein CA13_61500 [Planctomycetes bacterium CA13]